LLLSLYNAACPQNHISLAGLWLAAVARLAALVGPRVSISLRVRDTSALRFLRSLRLRLGGCCHERDERVTNGALHGVLGRAIERDHGLSLGNTAARKSVRHRMFSTPRLCPASAGLFLSSGRQLDACRQHPHPSICDPQPCHLEDPVFLVDALDPCGRQAASHKRNQDVGRDVLGRKDGLSADIGVGGDYLQRAVTGRLRATAACLMV
jgi:hypothetical protein